MDIITLFCDIDDFLLRAIQFLGWFWIPRTGRSGFLTAPDPPKLNNFLKLNDPKIRLTSVDKMCYP